MSASALILPPDRNQVYLGYSAIPCAPGEEKYVADREKIARWRQTQTVGQQWRRDSARAIEYWDGNQFDEQLAAKFKERGLPIIVHNCIKRWINSVVGMMERNQTDGIVRIDDERYTSLEKALTQMLKQAERMTKADRACLDAADIAFKGGIGWVEVGTNSDPFDYPDRVEMMPWRELSWDYSALKPTLTDAEWFRRTRNYKRSSLIAAMPQLETTIMLAGTENDIVSWYEPERLERDQNTFRDPTRWTTWGKRDDDVTLVEFRYRVWVTGYVVQTKGGPVIFDETNQNHMQAYYQGLVNPQPATYRRVRQSFWLGPHCLVDRWNPSPGNEIGWVPIICYMEDQTGAPYGLVRDMITLQDEINATKGKMHWSMDSTTIIGDHDRVMDWDDTREAVNRRDGVIVLNGAKPKGRFELDRHQGITQFQLEAYQDAVQKIGYVHGLEAPVAGGRAAGQSGISQQVQVDQSVTCIGKPMAAYKEARRKVLDLLLNQQIERMGRDPQELSYEDHDGTSKKVQINVPVQLEDGSTELLTLTAIKRVVALDDTPSTPTYRSQQFLQIVDTLRSMPEEAQKLLIPAMFEMSDLPNRQQYADMARKMLGLGGNKTPEEQQQEDQQAQMKEAMGQAMLSEAQGKARQANAGADEKSAKAHATEIETQSALAKILQEVQAIAAKTELTHAQTQQLIQDIALERAAFAANPTPDKTEAIIRW